MRTYFFPIQLVSFFVLYIGACGPLKAQTTFDFEDTQKLQNVILHQDSLFWITYNTCDLSKMQTFFTTNLEFYHDKGGLTSGLTNFMEAVKNGMCSDKTLRLRREVVEGSLEIYPIPGYGALLTGEHVFYVMERGKPERLDGRAKFLHAWQLKNNEWKMSRVFSYGHGPAEYEPLQKEIALPVEALKQFVGDYKSSQTGTVAITIDTDHLILQSGGFQATLYPESEETFFIKERNVQFKFVKNADKKVTKLLVIENGETVDEAVKN